MCLCALRYVVRCDGVMRWRCVVRVAVMAWLYAVRCLCAVYAVLYGLNAVCGADHLLTISNLYNCYISDLRFVLVLYGCCMSAVYGAVAVLCV